jgi:hypothetical protein
MLKKIKFSFLTINILGAFAWSFFFVLVINHPIYASSANTISAYGTSEPLKPGLIVQLDPKNPENVILASQSSIDKTFGVVVDQLNQPLSLQPVSNATNEAYVSSSGNNQLVVSNQNGPIVSGDYITLSSVDGIGMKDNSSSKVVVGLAEGNFSGTSNVIGSQVIGTGNDKQTVHFGVIEASISIANNPELIIQANDVPSFLENFSKTIAGKAVNPWRIYIALLVLFAVCLIVGVMLYGAVKSSISAIGRNPLSKNALSKGFIQIILSAVIIFISGIFGVYLLLRV